MSSAVAARKSSAIDDGELLRRVADGDLASLGTLYDVHGAHVRRFIGRMGVVPGDLDDLVQTTFLMALSASGHFDGRAYARAWLLGLAANAIRRHRRSLRRIMDRLVKLSHEPTPRTASSAEQAFSVHQTAARAKEAIGRLSQKKREVFLLVAVEGVSGEQAAAALHIPVATVWTRLHHARRDLRRLLGEDGL